MKHEKLVSPATYGAMIKYLLKQNIKKLIKEQRTMFLIIVLSLTVSSFGVLFLSGFFAYSYYASSGNKGCSIQIELAKNTPSLVIENLISNLTTDTFLSVTVSDGEVPKTLDTNAEISVIGQYSNSDKQKILTGRYFLPKENAPVIVMSETYATTVGLTSPLSQSIILGSTQYSVVGILFNAEPAYIIPVDYYIQNYPVTNIVMSYSHEVNDATLLNAIRPYSSNIIKQSITHQKSPFLSSDFVSPLIQILLMFSFTFLNIAIVISLWQKYFLRQYSIYYICGCTELDIIVIIILQIMLLSLVGLLLGLGTYVMMLPLFSKLSLINETLSDCLIITGLLFCLILVFAIILSIRIVRTQETYKVEE